MKKYIAPTTTTVCIQTENMLALSLVSGQGGNTTVIDVEEDPTKQLSRGMGWSSDNWADMSEEEDF